MGLIASRVDGSALVLFAAIGLFVGCRLGITRTGYVRIGLAAVFFSGGQIIHMFLDRSREPMTMLALLVGVNLVLFILLGALVRLAVHRKSNAA